MPSEIETGSFLLDQLHHADVAENSSCRNRNRAKFHTIKAKRSGAGLSIPKLYFQLLDEIRIDGPAHRGISRVRFRQELFPRRQRDAADQGETAGLDLARHLDDALDLI